MSGKVRVTPAENEAPGQGSLIDVIIGVMFSGGLDSTLVAAHLAERFRHVHLVTYSMGRGLRFMGNSRYHVRELQQILGEDRFTHHIVDNARLFRQVRKGFVHDYVEYCDNKAPFIYCLACKLAMHAHSIIFCLENGLNYWADGAIEAQNDRPEMMPSVLKFLEEFYGAYGIEFSSPIYYFGSRDDERRELLKKGFTLGLRTGDLHKTVQPLCIPGAVYAYWHYSAYPKEEDVLRFAQSKLPLLKSLVREHFERSGTVPEAVKQAGG